MEVKVKIEKTLHTDNDKVFYEDEDIAFEMEKTGDKYIGRIKKIKKKSIIIDDIMINREPANIASMKVKLDDTNRTAVSMYLLTDSSMLPTNTCGRLFFASEQILAENQHMFAVSHVLNEEREISGRQ